MTNRKRLEVLLRRLVELFETDYLNAREALESIPDASAISEHNYERAQVDFVKQWAANNIDTILDDQQAAAVAGTATNIRVVARAGAGKTRVLVSRALFLQMHCGVQPSEILLLAFNKKAAKEIEDRMREHVGQAMPHVMTFDALSYAIVRPGQELLYDNVNARQRKLTRAVAAIEQPAEGLGELSRRIGKLSRDLLRTSTPASSNLFSLIFSYVRANWSVYGDDKADLVHEERKSVAHKWRSEHGDQEGFSRKPVKPDIGVTLAGDQQSFDGTYVKSFGELVISNALFEHDIQATYEQVHDWNGDFYRPDFTISTGEDTGVVIEYFGCLSDPDYKRQADEKRRYWRQRPGWVLAEFVPHELASMGEADFVAYFLRMLKRHDIDSRKLSDLEIHERMPRQLSVNRCTKSFVDSINRSRQRNLTIEQLRALVKGHNPGFKEERFYLAALIGVYEKYLTEVIGNEYDDFPGLMWRAVGAVSGGHTRFRRYGPERSDDLASVRTILIDEFQDFNKRFAALLSATREANDEVACFVVGDAWQAINGFAGASTKYLDRFASHFEKPATYHVSTNYRSAQRVVQVSNAFMSDIQDSGPPAVPDKKEGGRSRVWNLDEFETSDVEDERHRGDLHMAAVLRLVAAHLSRGRRTVLLSRTNTLPESDLSLANFLGRVRKFFPEDEQALVTVSTTHMYKGRESEAVVIVDAIADRYPLVHPDGRFQAVFGWTTKEVVSEERRLFYVALSRAQTYVDVVVDRTTSGFLKPIEGWLTPTCLNDLDAPASLGGREVAVRVSNSFKYKDQLGLGGFHFKERPSTKYWCKVIRTENFDQERQGELFHLPGARYETYNEGGRLLEAWPRQGT